MPTHLGQWVLGDPLNFEANCSDPPVALTIPISQNLRFLICKMGLRVTIYRDSLKISKRAA